MKAVKSPSHLSLHSAIMNDPQNQLHTSCHAEKRTKLTGHIHMNLGEYYVEIQHSTVMSLYEHPRS